MTLPTGTRRLLIGTANHAELAAMLHAARPDLAIRGQPHTAITDEALAWADTYLGFKRPPRPDLGGVRWVHCTGAGVDAWLHPTELPRDILLTRTPESFGPPIAEWAVARALAFTQGLPRLQVAQAARQWAPQDPPMLRGARVLVVGTGDIGTHVARLFSAMGCQVTGVSRTATTRPGGDGDDVFAHRATVDALPALVAAAEWIILTLPLTTATRHLVNRALLSRCTGAYLLNAGRGAVVDEAVLPEALNAGWLRGAALDVFETEPLPTDSPLWSDPRVIISPHISGVTTVTGAVSGFLECLGQLEQGEAPRWIVDRERGY